MKFARLSPDQGNRISVLIFCAVFSTLLLSSGCGSDNPPDNSLPDANQEDGSGDLLSEDMSQGDGTEDLMVDSSDTFEDGAIVESWTCESLCQKAETCEGSGVYDECMGNCQAELESAMAVSESCFTGVEGIFACAQSLSCDDYEAWMEPVGSDYPCAAEEASASLICEADPECASACEVIQANFEECFGGFGLNVYSNNISGIEALLRPGQYSIAYQLHEDAVFEPNMVHEWAGPGAEVAYNSDLGIVAIDGLPTSLSRQLLEGQEIWQEELPTFILPDGSRLVMTNRLVVRLSPDVYDTKSLLESVGAEIVETFSFRENLFIAETGSAQDLLEAVYKLRSMPEVQYADPNYLRSYELRATPDDEYFEWQWHLTGSGDTEALMGTDIMAEAAWDLARGEGVILAINDDGVDYEHPDLEDKIVDGLNVPDDLDAEIEDFCCSHGTSVSGVAAGHGFNEIGVTGVCPECEIMPIFQDFFLSEDSSIAESFSWPAEQGAAAINNSWGPAGGNPVIANDSAFAAPLPSIIVDAIEFAAYEGRDGLGTVILFAAGNENEPVDSDAYVVHPLTIGVSSINDQGIKSAYSDFGETVDVAAPSDGGITPGITTTDLQGSDGYSAGSSDMDSDYTPNFGGTSSATPTVTGLVGLIVSANPDLTAEEVREILHESADRVDHLNGDYDDEGHSLFYGYGRINAYQAVRMALEWDGGDCVELEEEMCNGLDDNCDGEVDEGCTFEEVCEPCATNGDCLSGICAVTPGDVGGRCLDLCDADSCDEGYACDSGYCVPESGRCDTCDDDESCNGVDDDCDGEIDEDACDPVDDGQLCYYHGECDEGELCLSGYCFQTCEINEDCGDDLYTCEAASLRYGNEDGTSICVETLGGFSCLSLLCSGDSFIPEFMADSIIDCVNQIDPEMVEICDELTNCMPF